MTYSPDGSLLFSGDEEGRIFIWDAERFDELPASVYTEEFAPPGYELPPGVLLATIPQRSAKRGFIFDLDVSHDGRFLAVAYGSAPARVIDLRSILRLMAQDSAYFRELWDDKSGSDSTEFADWADWVLSDDSPR